jgi:integrase
MMGRFQQGYIYEASQSFFVRYYVTEIRDGQTHRVQRSHRLCFKDTRHTSRTCKTVRQLAAEFMAEVNSQSAPVNPANDQSVCEFWDKVYLTFIEENLRHSTVHGYKQLWNQHLKGHFGTTLLKDSKTASGSLLLTTLARRLGRHTLQHIRSLASGIFSHAVNVGAIDANPWHDVKILGKTIEPEETAHYTLEEAENLISALVNHVDAQLIISLAFFVGLRPGEIQGLRWEDFDSAPDANGIRWVHIRRAVARNVVGETKTKGSVASLPLVAPVLVPLTLWHQKKDRPTEGWVFPNSKGKPVDLRTVVSGKIVPTLEKANLTWKTLYAGRRGAATILTQLTGDALAAKELLRHKTIAVTQAKYVKAIPEALMHGIKLLEKEVRKAVPHDPWSEMEFNPKNLRPEDFDRPIIEPPIRPFQIEAKRRGDH